MIASNDRKCDIRLRGRGRRNRRGDRGGAPLRGSGCQRLPVRGGAQRRRLRRRAAAAPLAVAAGRADRPGLHHHAAAPRQRPHRAFARRRAGRLLLAQHPDLFQAVPGRLAGLGGSRRRGLGARGDGSVLPQAPHQAPDRGREGPKSGAEGLDSGRRAGRRSAGEPRLERRPLPRRRRLPGRRLRPRDGRAVVVERRLPAPDHGQAAEPDDPHRHLGAAGQPERRPCRLGLHRFWRCRCHQGNSRLRRLYRHPAAAAAVGHRPGRRPACARHRGAARPARRRREPDRPPRVDHHLGAFQAATAAGRDGGGLRAVRQPPRQRRPPRPDVPHLPAAVHLQHGAAGLPGARRRDLHDAEHPAVAIGGTHVAAVEAPPR